MKNIKRFLSLAPLPVSKKFQSKIFAQILLDRHLSLAEDVLPEFLCGFRPSCGAIDMIFCVRQLQENNNGPLFSFSEIWKRPLTKCHNILCGLSSQCMFVHQTLSNWCVSSMTEWLGESVIGPLSGPFPINSSLKQGYVLVPTCFCLYMAAMLNENPLETPSIGL